MGRKRRLPGDGGQHLLPPRLEWSSGALSVLSNGGAFRRYCFTYVEESGGGPEVACLLSGNVGDENTGGGGTANGSPGGRDDNAGGWDGLAIGFGGGRVVGLEMANWLSCNLLKMGKFMSELTWTGRASPAVGLYMAWLGCIDLEFALARAPLQVQ
ncbi:Hypothetical predicted protein [Olea europaea subsp. europaea]|uniref:Uncharacterized protein n=1 Tax=Olea europaea subsp. europaea TaxID=158383 RepID=A0A8S0SW19_OLEEU|nr:Hypothetical predicted protein [Olea europaea subsp. europaea]